MYGCCKDSVADESAEQSEGNAWCVRAAHTIWANTAPIEKANTASNGPCSRSYCKKCWPNEADTSCMARLQNEPERLFNASEADTRIAIGMPSVPRPSISSADVVFCGV